MAKYDFKLPDIGEGVVEGEVVTWHVSVGDSVSEDDPIVDVMTDKATVTIPSPTDGTVLSLNGEVGDMIAVGSVLIEFDTDGTVLETNVVEPADLTWEEGVTDEDGNQSTEIRTRTWTETGTQPVYQAIDQAKLVPLLTAALQEAIAKIETLETKVAALEAAN